LNTEIKGARQAAGLTVGQLAAKAGVSPAAVAVAEKGGAIDLEAKRQIATALEIDLEALWPTRGPGSSHPNGGVGAAGRRGSKVQRRGHRTP
jgi:transcriptional regulator with XRE-family HTH domain